MVGEVLVIPFCPESPNSFSQDEACVIGMDGQLSVGSTNPSFAPFRQWNKYIGNLMVGFESDPV
jgi:hypothetical protein